MLIITLGQANDRSRKAGVDNPEQEQGTGRQAGSGSGTGREVRRAGTGSGQAKVKHQEDAKKEKLGKHRS
jgi:hypothetical protein